MIPHMKSYFQSPLIEYLHWIRIKFCYERKYEKLRLGYMTKLDNVVFGKNNFTGNHSVLSNVVMGDFSYIGNYSVILEANIGKFCSIAHNVQVASGKHPMNTFVSTHPFMYSNSKFWDKKIFDRDYHNPLRQVTIGNDVWICVNAVIADGVTIGDGAIILSNTVVSKDVEPYTIVGGVPAKCIRKRFEDKEIEFLQKIKWWDKDIKWIENNSKKFLNIKDFISVENYF